jgi:hypothetical protein
VKIQTKKFSFTHTISSDTFIDLPGSCTLVLGANVWNSRWVWTQLSDLPNAAGRDDQPVASSHLALKEEGSALVGCVPQPPAQASISISIRTAPHHRFFTCSDPHFCLHL